MEKIESILAECIKKVRSGEVTLTSCLERYPSRERELGPLLRLALSIREPAPVSLDALSKQAVRDRLMQQIKNTRQEKAFSFASFFSFGLPPQMVWARITVVAFIALIVISMLGAGTVYAAQGSLPGDLLYRVKTGTEEARLWIAGGAAGRVKLNLEFSRRRLEEINRLAGVDVENTFIALNGYRDKLEALQKEVEKIGDAALLSELLESTSAEIHSQLEFCENALDNASAFEGPFLEAGDLAVRQQSGIINTWMQSDILRAAQVNFEFMQNRLQRAQSKVENQQYQAMQEAMLQYRLFSQMGERILEEAQIHDDHTAVIEDLFSQVLQDCMESLDTLSSQVTGEYRRMVETSRELTLEIQARLQYRYRHQGGFKEDSGSTPQPAAEGTGSETLSSGDGQGAAGGGGEQTGIPDQGQTPGTGIRVSGSEATPSQSQGSESQPGKGSELGEGGQGQEAWSGGQGNQADAGSGSIGGSESGNGPGSSGSTGGTGGAGTDGSSAVGAYGESSGQGSEGSSGQESGSKAGSDGPGAGNSDKTGGSGSDNGAGNQAGAGNESGSSEESSRQDFGAGSGREEGSGSGSEVDQRGNGPGSQASPGGTEGTGAIDNLGGSGSGESQGTGSERKAGPLKSK